MTTRCPWAGSDPLYLRYHDSEWGVPVHDDRHFFEMLVLEGAQAGLAWITILRKREGYRDAFDGFDPAVVARYDDRRVETLLGNPAIVRNRLKVGSAVANARAFLRVQEEHGSFDRYVWRFVDGRPRQNAWRGMGRGPRRDARVAGAEPGPEAPRLPLRWPHHLLRVHAGDGARERPPRRLLPPGGACAIAPATRPTRDLRRSRRTSRSAHDCFRREQPYP